MASLFGITSAKYQYAIDEYYRMKKEVRRTEVVHPCYCDICICLPAQSNPFWCPACQREEEKEETRLSEEAERSFDQPQPRDDGDEPITTTDQPEVAAAQPDATYQIEDENRAPSSTIRVPAIVTAT